MSTASEAEREGDEKAAFLAEMGRRIKGAIVDLGLTETKFCWRAEMHETLLRRWIKGQTNPTATHLANVARHLDVSVDYLLQLTDDPTPADRRNPTTPSP